MGSCLFCLREYPGLTGEHVFPAALGGNLVLGNSTCADCNNGSSKFEQPLVTELAPIRLIFQIPDRYGQLPQVDATVTMRDAEYDARVKRDGIVQLKPVVTELTGRDGSREFSHQFLTDRAREKLRQEAEDKGYQIIESGPGSPEQVDVRRSCSSAGLPQARKASPRRLLRTDRSCGSNRRKSLDTPCFLAVQPAACWPGHLKAEL